jgi:hypothetical protein
MTAWRPGQEQWSHTLPQAIRHEIIRNEDTTLDWAECKENVRRLRQRIFKAT